MVNSETNKNGVVKKTKSPVKSQYLIVNLYTLIAAVYCFSSMAVFKYVADNPYLAFVHAVAGCIVVLNYAVLRATRNFRLATHVILSMGTFVVISLFATGGWEGSGYLWPFAYLPYAFFLGTIRITEFWVLFLDFLSVLVVFLSRMGILPSPYTDVQLLNYFAALTIFITCMFLIQRARDEYEILSEEAIDAIKKSEENLLKSQEVARLGSWEWDMVKNKVTWSDELYRLFGIAPGKFEATYEAYLRNVHPDDKARVQQIIAQALQDKKPFDFYHKVILPGGEVRTIHSLGSVIVDEKGAPVKMNGTAQDVTAIKKTEERIVKQKEELEQLNRFMVDREAKMIELKREIEELRKNG